MSKKTTRNNRPINVNPFSIKLPISAITSIAHRMSGVWLFLMLPFFLFALQLLIETPKGYEYLAQTLSPVACKLGVWLGGVALGYHLLAGVRHILMDTQLLPENLRVAKMSAWAVWGATFLLVIWFGFRLFGGTQ